MKKIILLFCLVLFISCDGLEDKYGLCQVNYTVIYPDTTITYDTIFKYRWVRYEEGIHTPVAGSSRGSNYISLGLNTFANTTCPIRLNSYKTISKRLENE